MPTKGQQHNPLSKLKYLAQDNNLLFLTPPIKTTPALHINLNQSYKIYNVKVGLFQTSILNWKTKIYKKVRIQKKYCSELMPDTNSAKKSTKLLKKSFFSHLIIDLNNNKIL